MNTGDAVNDDGLDIAAAAADPGCKKVEDGENVAVSDPVSTVGVDESDRAPRGRGKM